MSPSKTTLSWTDQDDDSVRFSDDPEEIGKDSGTILAAIVITDGENGQENAVYVDEQDAREVIAWLSERLATR